MKPGSARTQKWRLENPERALAIQRRATKRWARDNPIRPNMLLAQKLKSVPCADCGGTFDPVCMDFDHRPGTKKVTCVAYLVRGARERFLEEVAKCDVVCANCHRLRTKKRRSR